MLEQETQPEPGTMKMTTRLVLIVVVLAVGVAGFMFLKRNGPKADKELPPTVVPVVRVITAQSGDHQLFVSTQGRVEPARRTQAAAEVMGRVTKVSERFKAGGVFKQDEIMLEMDSADYVSALASAEATLADAELLLEQEQARAEQARRDWAKLGRGRPSDLVLRKPQIVSATARVNAAQASVEKATRDLERTKLRAPYDCRVEATYTDLGSYITPGARLADLYSQDRYEVRMPVTMEELGYLKNGIVGSTVTVSARLAGREHKWAGEIIRSEGNVDRNTMTTHVVMQIKPDENAGQFSYPPPGIVIEAEIKGRVMENVTELPRAALREDNTVLTMTGGNKLKIVPVELARTMEKEVLVSSGLANGTRVITSPVEMVVNGMNLAIETENSEEKGTP